MPLVEKSVNCIASSQVGSSRYRRKIAIIELLELFSDIFAARDEQCSATRLLQHNNTGEMVEEGITETSTSTWVFPVVLIKKKVGTSELNTLAKIFVPVFVVGFFGEGGDRDDSRGHFFKNGCEPLIYSIGILLNRLHPQ